MIPPLVAHKGKVIDDRGVARDLVPRAEFNDDPRQLDPRFSAVAERYRTELRARIDPRIGLAAIVPIIAFQFAGGFGTFPWYANYLLLFLVMAIGTFMQVRISARRGAVPAAQALIAAGLCPKCAYSLHGLPVEQDGCTVCAECGAAWLHTRILDDQPYESAAGIDAAAHTKRWLGLVFGPGRTSTVKDEAQVLRTILPANLAGEIAAVADPGLRDRLQAAAAANIRKGRIARWTTVTLLAVVPILVLVSCFNVTSALGRTGVGTGVLGGLGSIALVPILISLVYLVIIIRILRNGTGISPKAIHREMLKRDLCPSCAADLRHCVPGEVTGFISCPRCTATWEPPPRYDSVPPQ